MKSKHIIKIDSSELVENFILEDLSGNQTIASNNKQVELDNDWHLLKIKYNNVANEIKSIIIDNTDIGYLLYAGYVENTKLEKFQPATSLWEEGFFNLWIHPNVGIMIYSYKNAISNGEFGTDLFSNYMLTVDRPVNLKNNYPDSVEQFFKHGFGPKWWTKDSQRPYKILNDKLFDDIDKEELKKQVKDFSQHNFDRQIGNENQRFIVHSLKYCVQDNCKEWVDDPYFYPLEDIEFPELKKLIEIAGFTSVLDVCLHEITPATSLPIHIDDPKMRKAWPYIDGCKRFFWVLDNLEGSYFKLGEAGLLPLDYPLMINTQNIAHSVVNDNNEKSRFAIIIEGVLPDDYDFLT